MLNQVARISLVVCTLHLSACSDQTTTYTISSAAAPAVDATLATKAQKAFEKNCAQCHGPNGSGEGGITYITDLAALVENGKVRRGTKADHDKSRVLVRLTSKDDPMPPTDDMEGNALKRPSAADIKAIKDWIYADSPLADGTPENSDFITHKAIEAAVLKDLKSQTKKKNLRYLSFEHLANSGASDAEIEAARVSLVRIMNSVTWAKAIINPETFGPRNVIVRVDLSDFGWDAEQWRTLEKNNPYTITKPSETLAAINKLTGAKQSILRGDYFASQASRPPFYYVLLTLPDGSEYPRTFNELLTLLNIDIEDNVIKTAKGGKQAAWRVGIPANESGVSRNNRLLERHKTTDGSFWLSYDFAKPGNNRAKNIYDCPLGPDWFTEDESTRCGSSGDRAFSEDGGEMIFALPNGLQAYMIVNAEGARIDEAPTEIVVDQSSPVRNFAGKVPGAVVTGISCMACHNEGMRPGVDKIRAATTGADSLFAKDAQEMIKNLYVTQTEADQVFGEDRKRFLTALKQTGSTKSDAEAFVAIVQRYQKLLGVKTAAAEFFMTPSAFKAAMKKAPKKLQLEVASLLNGGTMSREQFEDVYPDVAGAIYDDGNEQADEEDEEEEDQSDDTDAGSDHEACLPLSSIRMVALEVDGKSFALSNLQMNFDGENYESGSVDATNKHSPSGRPFIMTNRLGRMVQGKVFTSSAKKNSASDPLFNNDDVYWEPKGGKSEWVQLIFNVPQRLHNFAFFDRDDTLRRFRVEGKRSMMDDKFLPIEGGTFNTSKTSTYRFEGCKY